jgi:hypothetical protein
MLQKSYTQKMKKKRERARERTRERERNSRMDTGNEKCMLRVPVPIVM